MKFFLKSSKDKMDKQLGKLIVQYTTSFFMFIFIYLILILLYIYPYKPIDSLGWAILIVAGILISLYLEWIGIFLFSEKIGLKISNKRLSGKRIIFLLFICGGIMGILFSLWFVFRSFISQHFR